MNFVNRAIENFNLIKENKNLQTQLFHSFELIGCSQNIEKIKDQIQKLSSSESRVFITGPTGSGKELIARKIHKSSKRKNKPFIVLNGALLDVRKYELELFGEEKENGSISYGAFEKASGGILLIDEITEIHTFKKNNIPQTKDFKILYGGSVNSTNSKEIMNQENVDGVLVGSASLNIDEFNKIIKS